MILSIEDKGLDGGEQMGSGKREQRIFKTGMDFKVLRLFSCIGIILSMLWEYEGTDMLGIGAMVKKMLVLCMKSSKPTVSSIDVAFHLSTFNPTGWFVASDKAPGPP